MVVAIIQTIVHIFFLCLIICLFARMICSWVPVGQENPIVRFFTTITAPMLDPVQKRLPRMVVWMFDMNLTVAFIFVWWVLSKLDGLIGYGLALPNPKLAIPWLP